MLLELGTLLFLGGLFHALGQCRTVVVVAQDARHTAAFQLLGSAHADAPAAIVLVLLAQQAAKSGLLL